MPPTVSKPHLPSNAVAAASLGDVTIDQVVIGSCTNGRLEDLRQAASILRGRKVHPDVRCIILPGTQQVCLDAAADGNPIGTVTRTTPRFSKDYPPTLTAHDIGVKDLLDAFYMQGGSRDVILYAITIDPRQSISLDLCETIAASAQEAVRRIAAELGIAEVVIA